MYTCMIIVAKSDIAGYYDDGGDWICDGESDIHIEQTAIPLDSAIKEKWFQDILRENGFYHKDELVDGCSHLDKFVFDIKQNDYSNLYSKLSDIYRPETATITSVYQEVVGADRLAEVKKFNKIKDDYEKKKKRDAKKEAEKRRIAAENRKKKQLEKARKLLEEAEEI